jgi:hypothetical protein
LFGAVRGVVGSDEYYVCNVKVQAVCIPLFNVKVQAVCIPLFAGEFDLTAALSPVKDASRTFMTFIIPRHLWKDLLADMHKTK